MPEFIPNIDDANNALNALEKERGLAASEFNPNIEEVNLRVAQLEGITHLRNLPPPSPSPAATSAPQPTSSAPAPWLQNQSGFDRAVTANQKKIAPPAKPVESILPGRTGLHRAIHANVRNAESK